MQVGEKVKVNSEELEKYIKSKIYDLDEGWLGTMRSFAEEGTIGEIALVFKTELIVNFCGTPCGGFGLNASLVQKVRD